MKYRDLIHFKPITEVIRFGDLRDERKRQQFVETFVFSEQYRRSYIPMICSNLDFTETEIIVNGRHEPKEFFGLQIVGSYGTGKSHLMSLFSLIAEDEQYLQYVIDEQAKANLQKIAGKYKVLRFEINSEKELWGIICYQIDKFLASLGVDYSLTNDTSFENNDVKLQKMMAAFEEKYPDKGLLLVIDEMLAYLKGRSGADKLNRDLQVLQALAQISNGTKFRIAFGVQEMIYNAPEFQFAREMLLHVNDRYRPLTITKEDVKYIAEKRMLNKDDQQRQLIRDHLEKFTKYFSHMHGHIDDYITLFPVHPSYFENFEMIKAGKSQREIMKTLSAKFSEIIDQDIPDDQPGLICYDSYWEYMDGNATLKTDPDVARVSEIMQTINSKITDNFTGGRRARAALARRIANACAVKILQQDLSKTNGATAETLTNDLCYVNPMYESFDELQMFVESVAHNIQEFTAGQYFFKNKDNGEYHLCVEGGINYEELVNIYASNMPEGTKDEYFYQFLQESLPIEDEVYRSSFKIWPYAINWKSHNVTRDGYIFMGYDNERPTTQPEQHFYIYFPPIFDTTNQHFSDRPDEVYFLMNDLSEQARELIALYGSAIALGNNADSAQKGFYESLRKKFFERLRDLFDTEFYSKTMVQYCGQTHPLSSYPVQQAVSKEDAVSRVASEVFEGHFSEENGDYPCFTLFPEPTTKDNLDRRIKAAKLKVIKQHEANREGEHLLSGLGLWDGGLTYNASPYANSLLNILQQKPEGQVVNREEILHLFWRGSDLHLSNDFQIEDCYEFIVMATLVALGEIELVMGSGKVITAANIQEIEGTTHRDYITFRCIRSPRGYNFAALKVLFMGLVGRDLSQQLDSPSTIPTLMDKARGIAERAAKMEPKLFGSISMMGIEIMADSECMQLRNRISALKGLCDQLQTYSSKARIKNLPDTWTAESLKKTLETIKDLERLEKLFLRIGEYRESVQYLDQAIPYADDELAQKMRQLKDRLPDVLMSSDERKAAEFTNEFRTLRDSYAKYYLDAYRRCHINEAQLQQKMRLMSSTEYTISQMVCDAPFVLSTRFDEWERNMRRLETANPQVTIDAIRRVPFHGFNPKDAQALPDINQMADDIKDIYAGYVSGFRDILDDPSIANSIDVLDPEQQSIVQRFKSGEIELDAMYAPQLKNIISSMYHGLTAVEITQSDLLSCFSRAMSVEDAKAAFNQLVTRLSAGKANPRIIIKLVK